MPDRPSRRSLLAATTLRGPTGDNAPATEEDAPSATVGPHASVKRQDTGLGEPEGPRLVTDAMLDRLGRWLRALGRDVHPDPPVRDDDLIRLVDREQRILLTRDRRLCDRMDARCRVVRAQKPAAQLREIASGLRLFGTGWRDRLFTRCLLCNAPLRYAPWASVMEALPARVRADPRVRSDGARRWPACGRVYWEGSHTRRMRRW
ncbi:MAG: Mut7-C RNAse domain-containing protein, partial [Gemmatimonadota bacterium]